MLKYIKNIFVPEKSDFFHLEVYRLSSKTPFIREKHKTYQSALDAATHQLHYNDIFARHLPEMKRRAKIVHPCGQISLIEI